MRDTYSLSEAKARLSAILRHVCEGHRVIVTVHGEPVAEIRPVTPDGGSLERRMATLAQRGVLVRPEHRLSTLRPAARRPGALARFLNDRDG